MRGVFQQDRVAHKLRGRFNFGHASAAPAPAGVIVGVERQYWKQDAGAGGSPILISGANPMVVAAGSFLVARWSGADSAQINAPTDNAGAFTAPSGGIKDANGSDHIWAGIAVQANAAGGPHTITAPTIVAGGGGELILRIFEYTGMPAAPTLRQSPIANDITLTSAQSWTATTDSSPQAGDLALAISTDENSLPLGSAGLTDPPAGWVSDGVNQDATSNLPTEMCHQIVGANGAISASWSTVDTHVTEHIALIAVYSST